MNKFLSGVNYTNLFSFFVTFCYFTAIYNSLLFNLKLLPTRYVFLVYRYIIGVQSFLTT